jgi:hypothetical protein
MSEAKYLHIQAERCFRLASGPVSIRLADELEALGRAFKREARELELANGRRHPGLRARSLLAEAA